VPGLARRQVIGGLDVGTTKVIAVIAEVGPNGYPIIKGLGECPVVGIRKGTVFDEETLIHSMAQAVRLAENGAAQKVQSFYVSFPVFYGSTDQLEIFDENLASCVIRAGLEIKELVFPAVALAEAVLTDTDKNLGTVLMDIGGTTTGLAVFDQGKCIYTKSLPVGSYHITSDLAVGLRTTISEAERVKCALGLVADSKMTLDISGISGQAARKVPATVAVDIIKYRVVEILELARQKLKDFCRLESLSGGFILTGGGALLKGLQEMVAKEFSMPVKPGSTRKAGIPREEWTGSAYASAVGLMIYAAKRDSRRLEVLSGWRGVIARFR